jgi:peroxiredoxin
MYDEFEKRNVSVIAVAQEDQDLESHAKFLKHFEPAPRFELVADIGRTQTEEYHRTSTYLIDRNGVVRQVFPQLIHHRANWMAVLHEIDRLK